MTQREPRWTPQSTTPLEDVPSWTRPRLARGSLPPPVPQPIDDADTTAPRVRMVALFEPEPAVRVSLDRTPPQPRARSPRPRRARGAPRTLMIAVVATMALLGWLMLTR